MIVNICASILKILRLADREGATMGLIYEFTDRVVEKFDRIQGVDAKKLEDVKELCIERVGLCYIHPCKLWVIFCILFGKEETKI